MCYNYSMLHDDNITLNNATPIGQGRVLMKDGTLLRIYQTNKDPFITNKIEAANIHATRNLPYVEDVYGYNVRTGRKESHLIKGASKFQNGNMAHIRMVAEVLKKFHTSRIKLPVKFKAIKRLKFFKAYTDNTPLTKEERDVIKATKALYKAYKMVNCHNDLNNKTILFLKDEAYLYSIESAARNIAIFDLASFIVHHELDEKEVDYLLECYGNVNKKDVETMVEFVRIFNKYRGDYIASFED